MITALLIVLAIVAAIHYFGISIEITRIDDDENTKR